MNATTRTYRLNISTPDGQPLFTVLISRDSTESPAPASASIPAAPAQAAMPPAPVRQNGEPRMTEPQKRYLFRLLAQQGLDGKAAEAHLKDTFQVATLREVSKVAASQLIERMVADQKEGRNGQA
jgi:hypothetical protein